MILSSSNGLITICRTVCMCACGCLWMFVCVLMGVCGCLYVCMYICSCMYVCGQNWICKFEKPATEPNSLEPSTTVLSPYLKFGCLSARTFYYKLLEVYRLNKVGVHPCVHFFVCVCARILENVYMCVHFSVCDEHCITHFMFVSLYV